MCSLVVQGLEGEVGLWDKNLNTLIALALLDPTSESKRLFRAPSYVSQTT